MIENPNDIWDKFDLFMRERLKFMPEKFNYPRMDDRSPAECERMLMEIMDMLVRNDYNCKMREIMKEWYELSKEDAKKGAELLYSTPMPEGVRSVFSLPDKLKPDGLPK